MKASLGVFNGTLKAPVSLVIMIKAKSLEEEWKMKEVDADQGLGLMFKAQTLVQNPESQGHGKIPGDSSEDLRLDGVLLALFFSLYK